MKFKIQWSTSDQPVIEEKNKIELLLAHGVFFVNLDNWYEKHNVKVSLYVYWQSQWNAETWVKLTIPVCYKLLVETMLSVTPPNLITYKYF